MFSKQELPLHFGNKKSSGVSGMPMIDKWVALSLFWLFASLLVVFLGYRDCSNYYYNYSIQCVKRDCSFESIDYNLGVNSKFLFTKQDLFDSEVVKVDKLGNAVENIKVNDERNSETRLGYSVRMRIRLPTEPGSRIKTEKKIVLAPYDIGRRASRTAVKKINGFIEQNDEEDFSFNRSRYITARGLLAVVFGCVSMVLAVILGQWKESSLRAKKKY